MTFSLVGWLRGLFSGGGGERSPFAPGAGPARLLVMRHAEKTGDKNDMHLSAAGQARAEKLAAYIPQTFGKLGFIVAAMQSKHSNRSYETVVPLSRASGVVIDERFKDDQAEALIASLGSDPAFAGKLGIISWHHSALPALIANLGAAEGTYPDPWDPSAFDLIIDLTYPGGEAPPTVRQIKPPF
jgi:hypothetical protein